MARGWESKSVESQQSDDFDEPARAMSPDEAERAKNRERLELSRVRVARELQSATSPVHRTALKNALEFLDDELRKT